MGEEKAYIVRSMKAKCDCGTMENYLNVVHGHGVYYKGEPLLNANDHYKDENLSHFGDCNSKKVYEDAKKQADEKYKAEEGDGFFESVGKGIGSFFTKAAITLKSLMFNKCDLQTPTPWIFTNEEHVIDGAPALTIESKCACLYGGVITIVMEVEEVPTEEAAAEEETELKTIGTLAAEMAAAVQEGMGVIIKGDGLQSASVSPNSIPTVGMSVETAGNIQDSEPVRAKEVREETALSIGTDYGRSAVEMGKEIAFTNNTNNVGSEELILPLPVTKPLLEYMGILEQTEEDIKYLNQLLEKEKVLLPSSIMFFLATVAIEANGTWGDLPLEKWDDEHAKKVSYPKEKRGAGYIQLTGADNHYQFLKKKYNEIINSEELTKEEKESELKKLSKVLNEKGELKTEEEIKKISTPEIIAKNYAWDASVYFWKDKYNLDDYLLKKGVKIQTYLVIQYWVNSWKDEVILENGVILEDKERKKKIDEILQTMTIQENTETTDEKETTNEEETSKKEKTWEISLNDTLVAFRESEKDLDNFFGKYKFIDGTEQLYFINPKKEYHIFPLPLGWNERVEKYNLIMKAFPELGEVWELEIDKVGYINDNGKKK